MAITIAPWYEQVEYLYHCLPYKLNIIAGYSFAQVLRSAVTHPTSPSHRLIPLKLRRHRDTISFQTVHGSMAPCSTMLALAPVYLGRGQAHLIVIRPPLP